MKNRTYRAKHVKDTDLSTVLRDSEEPVIVGIDIAKHTQFCVLMSLNEEILAVLKWDHLKQSRQVIAWLASQKAVQGVVMEPSGTYGDALREGLLRAGVEVFRVQPKQVHDLREVYDGVPSSHDAKASAIIAWLHLMGRSEPWKSRSDRERHLAAALSTLHLHQDAFVPAQNRLEAQLARYWPEVLNLLALDSATLLALLAQFPGPRKIAQDAEQAEDLMKRVGRHALSDSKREAILQAARQSLGVRMTAPEEAALQELAVEARRRYLALQAAKKRLESLSLLEEETLALGQEVGRVTAVVLAHDLGSFKAYSSAGSLLKAAGLNLREASSGRHQGQLHITKRGSRRVRQYLYLAVLRWVQKDRWAKAWYKCKVHRDGGRLKRKGLVALMRKLLKGLWAAIRGAKPFDSSKLFETQRLQTA